MNGCTCTCPGSVENNQHFICFSIPKVFLFFGPISQMRRSAVPSGNQTWQWTMDHFFCDFPIKTSIDSGFSSQACFITRAWVNTEHSLKATQSLNDRHHLRPGQRTSHTWLLFNGSRLDVFLLTGLLGRRKVLTCNHIYIYTHISSYIYIYVSYIYTYMHTLTVLNH